MMYQNYYPNYYQPMAMPQQQPQPPRDIPFNDVRFATLDEAKAYIVMPNNKVMFMDRDNSVFYIKSADGLGKSTLEAYKYARMDENPTESVPSQIDLSEFVKSGDLVNFVTKQDIDIINDKIDKLSKQVRISEILKGGLGDGKQTDTIS